MKKLLSFFTEPRTVFWLGFVIAVAASALELFRGGAENYCVFRDATLQFWQGINSYTPEFVSAHRRYFIYSPVFCVLFTPFAYMPFYVGGFAWNLLSYTAFYFAIKNLPGTLAGKVVPVFLFLLLSVEQCIFPFQFNLLVAAIFVWAFVLLERDKSFWAVLLIMLSATTKIYGAVELALLCCYPRFWRNMGYAVLTGLCLLLLPVINGGFDGLLGSYQNWFAQLTDHHVATGTYYSLVFVPGLRLIALPYLRIFQASALAVLAVFFFLCHRRWSEYEFRVGVLAGLMMYIVLFSEASEYNTYLITMTGYALWFFSQEKRPLVDKILFWLLFVLWGVMPIDIFCPSRICNYVHSTLWIGVILFTVVWVRILYLTIRTGLRKPE